MSPSHSTLPTPTPPSLLFLKLHIPISFLYCSYKLVSASLITEGRDYDLFIFLFSASSSRLQIYCGMIINALICLMCFLRCDTENGIQNSRCVLPDQFRVPWDCLLLCLDPFIHNEP